MTQDRVTLETPEQVEVHLEVAGIAARAVACLIDTLFQGLIILAALVGLGLLGFLSARDVGDSLGALQDSGMSSSQLPLVMMALIGVIIFAVFWGYHVFFEMVTSGRTPGKRLLGLRVLTEAGTPVTLPGSLVRNLVRIIDFLPMYYGFGLVGMLTNRQVKRLGDLAAGTIVVRERPRRSSRQDLPPPRLPPGPVRLEPRVAALLNAFLERRDQLSPERRALLARRLARPLQHRFGGDQLEPEDFLEGLIAAHQLGIVPPWLAARTPKPRSSSFSWAPPGGSGP